MAKVHINDVVVCENPSPFMSNFQFQITFECTEELNDGLWRIICFDCSLGRMNHSTFRFHTDVDCFVATV